LLGASPDAPDLLWARREALEILTRLVAPMMPHIAEEMSALLDPNAGLVALAPWPEADPALLVKDEVTIAVQINGKLRATITVPAGAAREPTLAVARNAAAGALRNQRIVKEIFVPDRIVNFVVQV
jgi:leucyl-tRNA synthetase